ncbi:MAG: 4Fe-4S binding protein [Geobacteraceae bacterium]|nr:4Fe-4S binding protein [Geobacteraceae bacterium]
MERNAAIKTIVYFIVILTLVVGASTISFQIQGGKDESLPKSRNLVMAQEMTVRQFGQANELSPPQLKEIFTLTATADLEKKLAEYGTSEQVSSLVTRKLALAAEHASKNWVKIPLKFALWLVFLSSVFIFLRERKLSSVHRKWLLFLAVAIFGIVLGADPSPMGTVKDAIHLYGTAKVIFPPRMVALSVFLVIVLLANKYICAWGCQAGTLQELIFRINSSENQKSGLGRQFKLPFVVTNTFRVLFFCLFVLIVFVWGTDIIAPIDPFKIFKPASLGLVGGIFVGLLLLLSLFVYRPWCHLFCPFGLVGWLLEKFSHVKINVQYETCIACQKCAAACPSTVMGAILRRDRKTIPDCFACYTCRDICPTGSINFSTHKRSLPPKDLFTEK